MGIQSEVIASIVTTVAFLQISLVVNFVGIKAAADNTGYSREIKTVDVTTEILAAMNELEATFPPLQPAYFITKNSTVIMAQTGSIARIPCVVKNLGEATVSWIRRKDYHLLTVGLTSYTVDERYQPVHYQNSEDWTLQIRYVQKRDAGLYECQITSHPPSSIFVDFQVVEAEAQIEGSKEKYLKYGSVLHLVCTVLKSPEIPTYIFWYHNNQMVNYDSHRGFNVTLDLANKTSALYVPRTTNEHTGNYSCVPSNAHPDSTVVHILNGENPAAMQHGRGRGLSLFHCTSLWLLLICFLTTSILSGT
ncbi:zwei Ig domain protein zig-8-like [Planococcus citri]|uniref:zwei Ig domain protein zig-8-like n=1 Tax=Planococcus citri TaxID=170843 RepID=UPI0031F8949E